MALFHERLHPVREISSVDSVEPRGRKLLDDLQLDLRIRRLLKRLINDSGNLVEPIIDVFDYFPDAGNRWQLDCLKAAHARIAGHIDVDLDHNK